MAIAVYALYSCHRIRDLSFSSPSFVSGSLQLIEMKAYEMQCSRDEPASIKVTSHLRGSLSGSSEKKFVRALVSIEA